jgi:DNA integrity scanning protein DisA with diadenylate cyclase activity
MMSEESTKTMNDVVKEVKSRKVPTENADFDEKTLLDEFAMVALTGYLATNSLKDVPRRSYMLAQEMMEIRKVAIKGKLKD